MISFNKVRGFIKDISETRPIKINSHLYPDRTSPLYDVHFGLELGIVTCGAMRRHYMGYSRLVGRGQIWFCGMWEPHGFEVVRAPCEVIVLVIWPPLLAQLRFEEAPEIKLLAPFAVKPADRPQITSSKRKTILELAAQLKRLIAPSMPVEKVQIRICLLNILTMVSNLRPELRRRRENDNPRPERWSRLNRAVQLVFTSRSFISMSRAARECGLHPNIFSQQFKKWMGIRFTDFALQFRLKLAADQLLSGHEAAKAVARQWGFVDTSHFNRVFWKYYGCSPSGFRRHRTRRGRSP